MSKVTVHDLLQAGVHFGHQRKSWNPKMKPYIFGTRNNITIINLTVTMQKLAEACEFLYNTVLQGGEIMFVGTKRQAQEEITAAAQDTGMYYVSQRWLGGALTNFGTISKSIKKLQTYRSLIGTDAFAAKPKKEQSKIRREFNKLDLNLGGFESMKKMPAALVVIDVTKEHIAIAEAKKLGIPVVALVDSNGNPDGIDYVIPANDAALRSIKVILDVLVESVKNAKSASLKANEDAALAAAAEAAKAAETAEAEATAE